MQLSIAEIDYLHALVNSDRVLAEGVHKPSLVEKLTTKRAQLVEQGKNPEGCSFNLVGGYSERVNLVKLYRTVMGVGLRDAHDLVGKHFNSTTGKAVIPVHSNRMTYLRALDMLRQFPNLHIDLT